MIGLFDINCCRSCFVKIGNWCGLWVANFENDVNKNLGIALEIRRCDDFQ